MAVIFKIQNPINHSLFHLFMFKLKWLMFVSFRKIVNTYCKTKMDIWFVSVGGKLASLTGDHALVIIERKVNTSEIFKWDFNSRLVQTRWSYNGHTANKVEFGWLVRLPFFCRSLEVAFHFFLGRLSSWVKIRLHSENRLPRLHGSALKVPVGWVWWWLPTHYHV